MWGFRDEVQKPELQAICKIEHVGTKEAKNPDEGAAAAEALLREYPKLHGIFSQHTSPAQVVAAVKKAGRKDVWVATWGVSEANAKMLLEGGPFWHTATYSVPPVGGPALVNAIAKWHLGHDLPYYIGHPLVSATPDNVEQAWRQMNAGTADETPPWVKGKDWADFLKSVGKA